MFRKAFMIAVLSGTFFSMTPSFAHDGAVGLIKERMDLMKFIAQNTKSIAPIAMGSSPMNLKSVEASANAISQAASKAIAKFPKGSTSMNSEAKLNIWENWDEFKGILETLSEDAARLSQSAKDNDEAALLAQFGKMAKNCKTCHTKFREKKG